MTWKQISYISIANFYRLPKNHANLEPNQCFDITGCILYMLIVLNYYRYMYECFIGTYAPINLSS